MAGIVKFTQREVETDLEEAAEDDVVAGEKFEDGFLLVVVGLGVSGGEVVEEGVEDVVRRGVFGEILAAERGGHAGRMKEEEFTAKAQRARRGAKFLG